MQQIRTWLNNSPIAIVLVVVVLAVALVVIYLSRPGAGAGAGGEHYYFDLNTERLFVGPSDAMPPIDAPSGPHDGEPAGVRAHVFACGGCPPDLAGLSPAEAEEQGALIHHLETFTPEARRAAERDPVDADEASVQFEQMEAGRMVRRLDATRWIQAESQAGVDATVVAPCPDDGSPRQCRPGG